MAEIVIVAHPETGEMFTPTSKAGWLKCQLREVGKITVNNGVITMNERVSFPLLQEKVCKAFAHLKDGDKFPIPGQIQRILSREPRYEGHQTVKKGPDTDEEALIDGLPYYSQYTFTTNTSLPADVWVEEGAELTTEEASAQAAARL
jgi:hypothetical protein